MALLVGVMVGEVALTVVTAVPAHAAVLGDDYPSYLKNADTDALVDPWRFYNRECTSFVAWRLNNSNKEEFTNSYRGQSFGNAYEWGPAADKLQIKDSTPAIGAVAWWAAWAGGSGAAGHVAWVAEVNGTEITIEEYNTYWTPGAYHTRVVSASSVSGFIHIKDLVSDADADGIADKDDACPTAAGPSSTGGCPDGDGDQIADKDDTCPTAAGPSSTGGCPDGDSDQIADKDDSCPTAAGPSSTGGCPDSDSDQIADKDDSCPTAAGPSSTGGCPDSDGDRIADKVDTCPTYEGDAGLSGCPESLVANGESTGRVDFNGDGRADYCRRVGDANHKVQCTLSTGTGFGATVTSPTLDWGWTAGRSWVDFNADGKADYCRVSGEIGNEWLECTLSTGTGFGATVTSPKLDWGYDLGRAWVDFNGDGRADYCRRVGDANQKVQCTLSTGTGFGATVTSPTLDWGHDLGRAWTGGSLGRLVAPIPTISGSAKVGLTLAVEVGSWGPAPVSIARQWLRNGAAIAGATGTTYAVTTSDLGAVLSVRATGSRFGFLATARTSAATSKVVPGSSTPLKKLAPATPKISGKAKVGKRLTARTGTWKPAGVVFTYQWYRNGKAVKGATAVSYKLVKADRGKRIKVKVTGSRSGYTTAYRTSKQTGKIKK